MISPAFCSNHTGHLAFCCWSWSKPFPALGHLLQLFPLPPGSSPDNSKSLVPLPSAHCSGRPSLTTLYKMTIYRTLHSLSLSFVSITLATIFHNMYLFVCWPFVPSEWKVRRAGFVFTAFPPKCLKLCLVHIKPCGSFLQNLLILISVSEVSLDSNACLKSMLLSCFWALTSTSTVSLLYRRPQVKNRWSGGTGRYELQR